MSLSPPSKRGKGPLDKTAVSSKIVWYITMGLFLLWLGAAMFGCSFMTEEEKYCYEKCAERYFDKTVVKAAWLGDDPQWEHTRCACTIKVPGGTITYHIAAPLQRVTQSVPND